MAHRDPGRSRVMAWGLGSVVAHERHCTGPTQVACALADEANHFDHMCYRFGAGDAEGKFVAPRLQLRGYVVTPAPRTLGWEPGASIRAARAMPVPAARTRTVRE